MNTKLRRRAAEGAGERRCDVGCGYDLLGRFFRWHFFAGGRRCAWRRIDQAAVLDDFLDLRAVQGFKLKQGFCDYFQLVAIRRERLLSQLVRVIKELAHFLINLFGSRFAVIACARNVAAEENVIFVVAVFDHSHFLAHTPFANHPARDRRSHFDVAARAVCD